MGIPTSYAGEGVLVCGPLPVASSAPVAAKGTTAQKLASRSRKAKGEKEDTPEVTEEPAERGGKVAVRKDGSGQLMIEGPPGETFFMVRSAIYALHAAV